MVQRKLDIDQPCRRFGLPNLDPTTTGAHTFSHASQSHPLIACWLPSHGGTIAPGDVDTAFHRHGGNLRDALFDLYDCFERRIR